MKCKDCGTEHGEIAPGVFAPCDSDDVIDTLKARVEAVEAQLKTAREALEALKHCGRDNSYKHCAPCSACIGNALVALGEQKR